MGLKEQLNKIKNQIDTRTHDKNALKIRDIRWAVTTAGPSPFYNERIELFLLGCKKAMSGNPCKGCFNSTTWADSKALFYHAPNVVAEHITNNAKHKYITIGGGEPTDQIDNLIILCRDLKEKFHFNIMVYTWRSLEEELSKDTTMKKKLLELFKYVDIMVDGEFKIEEKLWDGTKDDGLISSVGSGTYLKNLE